MIPFVEVSRQYRGMKKKMDRAWQRVTRRGWFILGRELEAFEKEFAAYLKIPFAVGVGNGTDALRLALTACGVGRGDEVITVPNTAVPTVNAISATGAKPVFVDIDARFYTMDPSLVERKITLRTKALLPVHLYGHPADLRPLLKIARKRRLFVVEDACQAHGAGYLGKKAGTWGDIGCFSFYPSKNLGAYGDGGMAVTKSPVLARRLKLLRNYGQEKRYHHLVPGFNSRLDELQAAVLREKLKKLDAWNRRRRQWAARYSAALRGLPLGLPVEAPWARHCWHLYVIRTQKRDSLLKWLALHHIQALIHYPIPVHRQKAYSDLKIPPGTFPVAESFSRQILSLPLFPEMRGAEVEKVINTVRAFFKK